MASTYYMQLWPPGGERDNKSSQVKAIRAQVRGRCPGINDVGDLRGLVRWHHLTPIS